MMEEGMSDAITALRRIASGMQLARDAVSPACRAPR